MKGGVIDSLQLWVYKILDKMSNSVGNRLTISVVVVKKQTITTDVVHQRENPLLSLIHDGDTGWLGEFLFLFKPVMC